MKNSISLIAGLLCAQAGWADVVVAYWDFGANAAEYSEEVALVNAVGTPSLTGMSAGTGYDADGQEGVAFIDAAGTNHAAGQTLAWGSGLNDGDQEWTLSINLTGYEDIAIRWDYRSTGTGPTNALLSYRVEAAEWSTVEEISLTDDSAYHPYAKDLSLLTELNNAATVQFRLSGFTGGSGSGTHRIDNLQIAAIPEPLSLSLIGLFGLGVLIVRRFSFN